MVPQTSRSDESGAYSSGWNHHHRGCARAAGDGYSRSSGNGDLYWPLRVYTRYLLLEHAVRLVGSVVGQNLNELIQAADVVVVPSRESTPWWPIQAAWAARRPVVLTHSAAPNLVQHEKDSVLVYPSENSLVWGVERILFDPEFGRTIADSPQASPAAIARRDVGLSATRRESQIANRSQGTSRTGNRSSPSK